MSLMFNMPEAKTIKFPSGFLWGAATSAHQAEGGNNNNWTAWEKQNAARLAKEAPEKFGKQVPHWDQIKNQATDPKNYISGQASDHYNRYKEDIEIVQQLGLNTFRFSIEWSRVEPNQGQWDQKEIDHYRGVLNELKSRGIQPMVTLWHRSLPVWVHEQGGWENKKTIRDFLSFSEKVLREIAGDVTYWTALNEPMLEVIAAFVGGEYPPQKKNIFAAVKAFRNFAEAQKEVYFLIHKYCRKCFVGFTHAGTLLEPYQNKWYNKVVVRLGHFFVNWLYLNATCKYADFIGVQYYTRGLLALKLENFVPKIRQIKEIQNLSDMGWEIYPEGLYKFCELIYNRYKKPIILTENGITDASDQLRESFIKQHLLEANRAISDGIDIRGYIYWSLLDNLEWNKGFWPKFGLIEVNRENFERKIRPSAYAYAKIARANELTY